MTELILRDILVQICWSYCTPTSELLYKGWTSIVLISNHSSGNLNTLWVAASKLSCQRNFAQFYNYHQIITSAEGPLMGVFSVLKLPTCAITLKIHEDKMSLRKICEISMTTLPQNLDHLASPTLLARPPNLLDSCADETLLPPSGRMCQIRGCPCGTIFHPPSLLNTQGSWESQEIMHLHNLKFAT